MSPADFDAAPQDRATSWTILGQILAPWRDAPLVTIGHNHVLLYVDLPSPSLGRPSVAFSNHSNGRFFWAIYPEPHPRIHAV